MASDVDLPPEAMAEIRRALSGVETPNLNLGVSNFLEENDLEWSFRTDSHCSAFVFAERVDDAVPTTDVVTILKPRTVVNPYEVDYLAFLDQVMGGDKRSSRRTLDELLPDAAWKQLSGEPRVLDDFVNHLRVIEHEGGKWLITWHWTAVGPRLVPVMAALCTQPDHFDRMAALETWSTPEDLDRFDDVLAAIASLYERDSKALRSIDPVRAANRERWHVQAMRWLGARTA